MGFILGLDASTSKVGTTLFSRENGVIETKVIEPKNNGIETKLESLHSKCEYVAKILYETYYKYKIDTIVIEESLPMSKQAETFVSLKFYNEHLRYLLEKYFKIPIQIISVDEARRFGVPMLMGVNKNKKNVLFGGFSDNVVKNKKYAVLFCVSKLFPALSWKLNRNGFIHDDNLDCADSIAVILAFLNKKENIILPSNIQKIDIENFISLHLEYEKLKSQKTQTAELKEEKKRYLLKLYEMIKLHIDDTNSLCS